MMNTPVDSAVILPTECRLCPRACGIDRARGERGVCGADDRMRVARAALHFWEEPAISGTAGSGTVFFSHCPLHCVYCQNIEIASGARGKDISVARLAEIFLELEAQGAHNINLVTPSHYVLQIKEALIRAKHAGLSLPVVYNCSGYESVRSLRMVEGLIDIYLTDFKYLDAAVALRYSSVPEYARIAEAALAEMVSQKGRPQFDGEGIMQQGVIVRHLMLPGHLDDSRAVVTFLHERFGDSVLLSLMNQYTPMGSFPDFPELEQRVDESEYEALLDYADSLGIEDYCWQEGGSAEASFIPEFGCAGV